MFSASKTAAPVASGSFQVSNSLRFRSSASAYLNRTPSVAGNRQTWTWSGWMKLGASPANTNIFGCTTDNYNVNYFALYFHSTLGIRFENVAGGATQMGANITSQVFRDPSAWYHIILAIDTTQATASNRVKFYVNGVQVTNWAQTSYPAQNAVLLVNSTIQHDISSSNAGLARFDGYMAEVNFIDGQALTPSSFGSINATTGVWQPARYTGSYGTNGFYLKFNNGTSTTTLGNDSSGNSNNWTTNNISLTAGSTYDWMIDSPTSYAGSSYGVGNYAVLNPLLGNLTLSGANLNVTDPDIPYAWRTSTFVMSGGKWYFEYVNNQSGTIRAVSGVSKSPYALSSQYIGAVSTDYGLIWHTGEKYNNGTLVSYQTAVASPGDIIMTAIDLDSGKIWWGINGTWGSSGNPAAGTNPAYTGLSGTYYFAVQRATTSTGTFFSASANHGQRPFAYTPPSGFKSLCTQNLTAPTIVKGSAHMNAVLDTGANIKTTSQALYTYYLEWIKDRANVNNHQLADTVRGNTAILQSNTSAAETTYTAPSGNSVGWVWNANAAAVSNTSGTITSSVSANTTAGFSIVRYLNNGVASTVGHGLGVAPSMIIIKNKTVASIAGTNTSWATYHSALGASGQFYLDLTNANTTAYSLWNSTSPTSNVFSVSAFDVVNSAYPGSSGTYTYIAYCFAAIAGYSAFGSYTGNGSTDGPFVYCGFRPRWVMLKSATQAYRWYMLDSSRNTYNVMNGRIFANSSDSEQTNSDILDFVSNGFKLRTSDAEINGSGQTIIYAAFAENPFQNSLAR